MQEELATKIRSALETLWFIKRNPALSREGISLLSCPDLDLLLILAIELGDLNALESLINLGVDVKASDSEAWTPLHYAAKYGRKEIVIRLLSKGALLEARTSSAKTPLHKAAEMGHKDVAEILIGRGADVNYKDKWGEPPLYLAIVRDRRDVADLLISAGTNLTEYDISGFALLHIAAANGRTEILEFMISGGADIDILGPEDQTPLHLAIMAGQNETARMLVSHGANVNIKDRKGRTPLHLAFLEEEKSKESISKLLKQYGARWSIPFYDIVYSFNKREQGPGSIQQENLGIREPPTRITHAVFLGEENTLCGAAFDRYEKLRPGAGKYPNCGNCYGKLARLAKRYQKMEGRTSLS